MNILVRKKLNVLAHLARVDGKFHASEQALLMEFMREKGMEKQNNKTAPDSDKAELLFWALRLVRADGVLHENELSFCRNLALKLGFRESIVDDFVHHDLPDYAVFKVQADRLQDH